MNYPTLLIASALLGQGSGTFTVPNYPGLHVTTNYTPLPNVEYFWGPVHKSHTPALSTNWVEFGNPAYDLGLVSDGSVVWRLSPDRNIGDLTNRLNVALFTLSATNITSATSDEAILNLVKSGEVCRVIGHKWQPHFRIIAFSDEGRSRKCNVCEKVETQEPGEWK